MAKTGLIITPLVPVINQHIYPTIVADLEALGCNVIQTDKLLKNPKDPMEHAKLMLDTLGKVDFVVYLDVMMPDSWVAGLYELCTLKSIPEYGISRQFLSCTPDWRRGRLDYFLNQYIPLIRRS